MIEMSYKISYPHGLHARPATLLVAKVSSFQSQVILTYKGSSVNMKSIMGVLSLGVPENQSFKIMVDGVDEQECMLAIQRLIADINQSSEKTS
jgi:phosphocarrier protein HPr